MLVDKKKFVNILGLILVIGLYAFVLLNLKNTADSDTVVKISSIGSLIILAFEIIQIYYIKKSFFTPVILLMLSYYIFQNGQLLLLALGVDFNNFYIMTLKQYNSDVAVFSSISTAIAGLAAYITLKPNNIRRKTYKIDLLGADFIASAAFTGFCITACIAIPLILIKARIGLSGGYSAVRMYESTVPSIFNFIEYMFMPFSVLCMVYCVQRKKRNVIIIIAIWAILTSLCGDRTTGIGVLVIILYFHFSKRRDNQGVVKKLFSIIRIIISALLLLLFIQVAYTVRTQGSLSEGSIINLIISTISDLGFSCFPLYTMMNIVPSSEGFMLGKGYLLSFIGGCIPSFIDFTGTIRTINTQSRVFETWQNQYYGQYSFGFGFSLNAEAYINFGWYGLIVLFFITIFIFKMINEYDESDNVNLWGKYKSLILVFLWFTLPRRDSYYIWKAISYSIIIMKLYLLGMKSINKK